MLTFACHNTHSHARTHTRTHTHTQETHVPSLFPGAPVDHFPLPLSALCSSIIQFESTYRSLHITQITPPAITTVSASLSYLFKVSYDPFHSITGSSRHDWVVPYLRGVSRDAAVHNGNITIKHSHRPVLVIKITQGNFFCSLVSTVLTYNRCINTETFKKLQAAKKEPLSYCGGKVWNPIHTINDPSCKRYRMKYWICLPTCWWYSV